VVTPEDAMARTSADQRASSAARASRGVRPDRRALRAELGRIRAACGVDLRFVVTAGLSGRPLAEFVLPGGRSVAELRARAVEAAGDRANRSCRLILNGMLLQDDEQMLCLACFPQGFQRHDAETTPLLVTYVRLQEVWGAVALVGGGADIWRLSESSSEARWSIPTPSAAPADPVGPRGAYSVGTTCVTFSPDASRLVTAFGNGTASVWDVDGEALIATLKGHSGGLNCAVFSPDGLQVATGSHDRTARIWSQDPAGWKCDHVLLGHTKAVWSVVFSSAGNFFATASRDSSARLWCASSGECLRTFLGHAAPLWCIAFSADGSRLATSSSDRTVRVWDPTTGECWHTLEGHSDTVTRVSFTPGDRELLSSSRDGSVRIWALETQLLQDDEENWQEMRIDSVDRLWATAMSPDGNVLLSVSGDGAYTVRKTSEDEWGSWRRIDGQSGLACALAIR